MKRDLNLLVPTIAWFLAFGICMAMVIGGIVSPLTNISGQRIDGDPTIPIFGFGAIVSGGVTISYFRAWAKGEREG